MRQVPRTKLCALRAWSLLLIASTACENGEPPTPAHTSVDSAGVIIVTSTRSSLGEQIALVDSIPVLRIGAEEAGPYQFGFIGHALLLDEGRIAVTEMSLNEVRIFDSSGMHLQSFGRRGRGPGEFGAISGLFEKTVDSLLTFDQVEQRITVFPLSGGVPGLVRAEDIPSGRGTYTTFGALGDGRLLLYTPGSSFRPDLQPGQQWDTTHVVVLDPIDGSSRTIARLRGREQFVLPGGDTDRRAPAQLSIQAATDSGFYWGTSDRYEIHHYDMDGTLRRILRRPVQPKSVEPGMIDAFIEQNLELVRQREGEEAAARQRAAFADAPFGKHVPLFERAFVDRDARLWVLASDWPRSSQTAPRRWSVFLADGTWLGDVNAPSQLRIADSRGNMVLGVWQEDGEAPSVHLHRVLLP